MRFEDIDDYEYGVEARESARVKCCGLCGAERPYNEFVIFDVFDEASEASECIQCRKQLAINKIQREQENVETGEPDETLAYFETMDLDSFLELEE